MSWDGGGGELLGATGPRVARVLLALALVLGLGVGGAWRGGDVGEPHDVTAARENAGPAATCPDGEGYESCLLAAK
eukprot:5710192-Pyramimonas_sp.AAC.1